MKKTIRKILAAVLALTMLLGNFTAFAAEDKESIVYGSDTVLPYAGELKEGENSINFPDDSGYAYVEFTAEKDGYYLFTNKSENLYYSWRWLRSLEKSEDGKYYLDDTHIFSSYGDTYVSSVFYFEAGEVLCIIMTDDTSMVMKAEAEYLGAEITDIDFSEGIDYPMIPEYDIYHTRYDAPGYSYAFYAYEPVVTFDSGKTIGGAGSCIEIGICCSSETEMTDGEYTVNVYFADKTFEKTIEVRPVTAYIEKIEAIDPEKFYGIEYYDGDCFYLGCNATYNVTFTSGETVQVGSETDFEVPGLNRELWISREYNETSEGAVVEIEVLDHEFAEYPCEIKSAEASENFSHMADECSYIINDFIWECEWYYDRVERAETQADTLRALGKWISHINNNFIFVLGDVVAEFNACLAYTMVNH